MHGDALTVPSSDPRESALAVHQKKIKNSDHGERNNKNNSNVERKVETRDVTVNSSEVSLKNRNGFRGYEFRTNVTQRFKS